jgi:hypothetical protein
MGFDFKKPKNENTQMGYNEEPQRKPKSVWDKINEADVQEKTPYALPGLYPMLYLDSMKMITTQEDGHDLFVAEFDILESNVSDRPAGTRVVWTQNFSKFKGAANEVVRFVAKLTNSDFADVGSNEIKMLTGPDNPGHGLLVKMQATAVNTKGGEPMVTKGGDPFCKSTWYTIDDETQKKADEFRQAAGFAPF